jgi:hypothetical protein
MGPSPPHRRVVDTSRRCSGLPPSFVRRCLVSIQAFHTDRKCRIASNYLTRFFIVYRILYRCYLGPVAFDRVSLPRFSAYTFFSLCLKLSLFDYSIFLTAGNKSHGSPSIPIGWWMSECGEYSHTREWKTKIFTAPTLTFEQEIRLPDLGG